jgi:hypothetical protein
MSGDPSQAGIPRPQHVAFGNSRIQEMSINQSDAAAMKVPLVNKVRQVTLCDQKRNRKRNRDGSGFFCD